MGKGERYAWGTRPSVKQRLACKGVADCGIYRQHHVIKRIAPTLHTCPPHLGVTLHAVGQAVLSQQALHGAQGQHAAADAALAHKQHSRLATGNRGTQGRDRKEVNAQNCESTK